MIAIGIPTYNEAQNIVELTQKIDNFANGLNQEIVIVNSDNNSPDNTSDLFKSVETKNLKVALNTSGRGKGKNIKCILEYVAGSDIDYCLFIDGDVSSIEKTWLEHHIEMANKGFDYVVPEYARCLQEGNTTNHFVYPTLYYLTGRKSPKQPIAGDFGVSSKLAKHLLSLSWSASNLRYGVDTFMTMHALSDSFSVAEISLNKKIHNPSFDKMINIFTDEAISYFECREVLRFNNVRFNPGQANVAFISGLPISSDRLNIREVEAQALFNENGLSSIVLPSTLSASEWATVLVRHEKMLGHHSAEEIAKSLCSFFLIRVTSYLREATDSTVAEKIITEQTEMIYNKYKEAKI